MKTLLLGGTGAMGSHLVDILSKQNVQTFVTSRKKNKNNNGIIYVQGNAMNDNFLNELLKQKWDVIVDFMIYKTPVFNERIYKLLDSTSQYIFLSSARVYAESKDKLKENSLRLLDCSRDKKYLATDEYALKKAKQENILKNSGFKNWTIIRPYITYSEERLQLGVLEKEDWLYRALKGRSIVFSEEINNKLTTMTYGYDVANCIFAVLKKKEAYGEVFHITSPNAISWKKILDIYLGVLENHLGYRPDVILQSTDKFIKWREGEYQIIYDRLYNRTFDNTKILKYISTDNFENTEYKLSKCLESFLKNPNFKTINWRKEALKDGYVNEHTKLNEIKGISAKVTYISYRYFNWLIENIIKKVYKKY